MQNQSIPFILRISENDIENNTETRKEQFLIE